MVFLAAGASSWLVKQGHFDTPWKPHRPLQFQQQQHNNDLLINPKAKTMNQFKTRDLLVCILPTGAGNPANPKMNVLHASEVGGGRCIPPSKDKNRREYSRCVPPSKDKQQIFTGAGIQPQLSAISNANALDRLKQAVARLQQNSKPFASA